jgi:hypothetical protein
MSRVHLVTQAYGLEEVRVQAHYLALSALAWREGLPLEVHVYTDAPEAFAALDGRVHLRVLSADDIRRWRGPLDFTHRLKVEMIRELAGRFPSDKLLYLDADTFFVSPVSRVVERIGPGRGVMHEREYNVATRDSSQLRKFRKHMGRLRFEGGPVDLTRDMWNAGALGLDPADFGMIPRWLAFVDTLYPRYRRGLVEQYGAALMLQQRCEVSPCTDEVFHYWAQKDEYVAAIRERLAASATRAMDERLAEVREHPLRLPPPVRRKHRTTLWGRIRRVLKRAG